MPRRLSPCILVILWAAPCVSPWMAGAGASVAHPPQAATGLVTLRLNCSARGAPPVQARLQFKESARSTYTVTQVEVNQQGRVIVDNGKNLPKVRGLYDTYVLDRKPMNRLLFRALLGSWKVFGTKFQWGDKTYLCKVT